MSLSLVSLINESMYGINKCDVNSVSMWFDGSHSDMVTRSSVRYRSHHCLLKQKDISTKMAGDFCITPRFLLVQIGGIARD
jgi:hypothetical protein